MPTAYRETGREVLSQQSDNTSLNKKLQITSCSALVCCGQQIRALGGWITYYNIGILQHQSQPNSLNQSVSVVPRSLNYLSFPLRPKKKRDSQDTVTPSDIINKQKPHKETNQPAKQPASHHLNRLLKETHTERKEANAYFDQQVSRTKRNTTNTNATACTQPSLRVGAVTL